MRSILAIALIILFFMPWLEIGPLLIYGYKVPDFLAGMSETLNFLSSNKIDMGQSGVIFKVLYLIPILSINILYSDQADRDSELEEIIVGIIPFVLLFYMFFRTDADIFSVLSWGAVLTLLVSLFMLLIGIGVIDPETYEDDSEQFENHDKENRTSAPPLKNKGGVVMLRATAPSLPFITLLPDKKLLVGRSRKANVRIENAYMSAEHLTLERKGGEILVIDKGSTNGTYIDGRKLLPYQIYSLKKGEKLVIGSEDVVYSY